MTFKRTHYEILSEETRSSLLARLLSLLIPISFLIAISGVITNIMGVYHPHRFMINIIGIVVMSVVTYLTYKGQFAKGLFLIIVSATILFSVSTLLNGGVQVPNYIGFLVVIVIASTFSSRRMMFSVFIVFVLVGAISITSSGPLARSVSFPSPFRYWTMYSLFGLLVLSVLTLTRQTLSRSIEQLANQTSLLSSILNLSSDAVIVLNEQYEVIHMSSRALELERVLSDEPSIISDRGLIHYMMLNVDTHKSAPLIDHINFQSLEPATLNLQLTYQNKQAWYSLTTSPQLLENEHTGIVISIRDVTDRHRLNQAQKMSAVSVLANGIAHDFNNMLGAIQGATDLLALELEDEQEELLDIIGGATLRSAELIQQLRLFSSTQSHTLKHLNMHTLIKRVSEVLRRVAIAEHTVICELEATSVMISGDQGQLHSAFMNLGVNALQAMKDGGRLTFRTYQKEITRKVTNKQVTNKQVPTSVTGVDVTHVNTIDQTEQVMMFCIDVIDEGVGIPPEIQDRIFEPFFTTRDVGSGTGLGLAGVHGAVKRHGGIIELHTRVGHGTTMTVLIPLIVKQSPDAASPDAASPDAASPDVASPDAASPDAASPDAASPDAASPDAASPDAASPDAASPDAASPEPYTLHIKRILIVDDEALIRQSLSAQLHALGIDNEAVPSGDAALERLREFSAYDLVILDMLMPGKNGREVFYELKIEFPHIPVLISSGFAPEGMIAELMSHGLVGVLEKPYRLYELQTQMNKTVARLMSNA